MSSHRLDDLAPLPTSSRAAPPPPSRRRRRAVALGPWVALVLGGLALVGLALGGLRSLDPTADEWRCSQGEVPTYVTGPSTGSGGCVDEDAVLPAGVERDPLGNRPMPSTCDRDGWVLIERTERTGRRVDVVQDCLRDGAALPAGWRRAASS